MDHEDNYKAAANRTTMRMAVIGFVTWLIILTCLLAAVYGEAPSLKPGSRVTLTLKDGTQVTGRVFIGIDGPALLFPYGMEIEGWQLVPLGETPNPPKPPDPPQPPDPPVPVPAGIQVLVVYDPLTLPTLPKTHPISSKAVRDYMDAKCAKGTDSRPSWRIWPTDMAGLDKQPKWKDTYVSVRAEALKQGKPVLAVYDQSGKVLVSQVMPDNEADCLALLKKYGG